MQRTKMDAGEIVSLALYATPRNDVTEWFGINLARQAIDLPNDQVADILQILIRQLAIGGHWAAVEGVASVIRQEAPYLVHALRQHHLHLDRADLCGPMARWLRRTQRRAAAEWRTESRAKSRAKWGATLALLKDSRST